jgi:nucleoside-diphosphate-sugar epimerase
VKILVTGATGFIGSHVTRELVQQGHEVHALVLPEVSRQLIADVQSSLHFIEADLLSPSFALPPVSFDVCIHLAWYVEPGKYLHSPLNQDFVRASLVLAKYSPRFIAAGTCFEYALTGEPLTESSRTEPRTPYAQAKLDLFHALPAGSAWVRFFYQYGPGEHPQRLVPVVISKLLHNEPVPLVLGDRVRDFLYIEDVATAVCAVATSGLTGAVNIGSGRRTTVRDIAGKIADLLGRPELLQFGAIPYRPDEPLDILADNTKLCSTGWRPSYDLSSGLRATIKWWQSQSR